MEVIQYKCPNCGGELRFNPDTGKFVCTWCRSSFTEAEMNQYATGGNEVVAQEEAGGQAAQGSASGGKEEAFSGNIYICPSCGANIMTDSTTAATFCYYCHNPVTISGRLTGADKPDFVVPFKISKEKALQIFEDWIKTKKYVPSAFYTKDQMEKISGVYFPFMVYSCDVDGHIDAVGTRREVYRRGDVEFTETGTYHVQRSGSMKIQYIMRNALKKNNKKLVEGVLPFETEEMKPFTMSYLSGFMAEKRDMGEADFRSEVDQEVRNYAVNQLQGEVMGYEDLRVTGDNTTVKNEKWQYALLPTWSLTYKDPGSGEIYYFSINGQTGKTIGELPIDQAKLRTTFLATMLPIAAVLMALLYFIF